MYYLIAGLFLVLTLYVYWRINRPRPLISVRDIGHQALIRLKRESDNAERDFYADPSTGILDAAAIAEWGGDDALYVVWWYGQSKIKLYNATASRQPSF